MHENKKIFVTYSSPLKTGDTMTIKLRISNELGFVNEAKALFNRNGEEPGAECKCYLLYDEKESKEGYSTFIGNITFETPGYRTFYIKLKLNGIQKEIRYDTENEIAVISNDNAFAFWKIFVYYSFFETPNWIKGGIMYQIFVDTFCSENLPENLKDKVANWNVFPKWQKDEDGLYRNDQFYGGNLKGIIKKLDYIKSLGVTVIYLTPIFKSPSSNRYDIDDYEVIDEMIGTWDDLAELHEKANAMGIGLVVDVVFNHSGKGNKLLQTNPDMYEWKQKYTIPRGWWNYEHLVEFNKWCKEYFENLARWLLKYSNYMDGVRLDVADNLPDYALKFIRECFKKFIRKFFKKYILGEVWKNAITGDYREFLYGDELDGVMNYQFANAIYRYVRWGNFSNFKKIINDVCALYPNEALDVSPIFLSSHDIPRIPNILVGEFMKESSDFENVWDMEKDDFWRENGEFDTCKFRKWELENDNLSEEKQNLADKLQKIVLFMQYTLPGLPSIFAGDEAGVTGFKDPFNRKTFPWENMNQKKYEEYCKLGFFRNSFRNIFADSRNFQIIEIDEKKFIYKRGEMLFIVNRTSEEIHLENYSMNNVVFSFDDLKMTNTIPAFGVVAM